MSIIQTRYFPEINLLRGVAILGVIGIHVSMVFTSMNLSQLSVLYMSIDSFAQAAVPLFIFVSGFVLYNKYNSDISLRSFYKKRLLSVIPQYICFSIAALMLIHFATPILGGSINLDIAEVAYRLLAGQSLYHLWFMILIIQFYILYPLINEIYNVVKIKGMIVSLLIIAFLIQSVYRVVINQGFWMVEDLTQFLGYILFFIVGMHARSNIDQLERMELSIKTQVLIFIVVLFGIILQIIDYIGLFFDNFLWDPKSIFQDVFFLVNQTVSSVIFLMIIFIFYIASRYAVTIGSGKGSWLDTIGTLSFGIYLVHAFVLYALQLILKKMDYTGNNVLYFPVVFLCVLISSILIVMIIKKVPHHQWIIGK